MMFLQALTSSISNLDLLFYALTPAHQDQLILLLLFCQPSPTFSPIASSKVDSLFPHWVTFSI